MSPEYCFAVHSAPVLLRTNVKTPMVMLSGESENPNWMLKLRREE